MCIISIPARSIVSNGSAKNEQNPQPHPFLNLRGFPGLSTRSRRQAIFYIQLLLVLSHPCFLNIKVHELFPLLLFICIFLILRWPHYLVFCWLWVHWSLGPNHFHRMCPQQCWLHRTPTDTHTSLCVRLLKLSNLPMRNTRSSAHSTFASLASPVIRWKEISLYSTNSRDWRFLQACRESLDVYLVNSKKKSI